MQAHALPDHTAQTVAKVVVEEWICKMGAPYIIHSDQGADFESNLFREMCHQTLIKLELVLTALSLMA